MKNEGGSSEWRTGSGREEKRKEEKLKNALELDLKWRNDARVATGKE